MLTIKVSQCDKRLNFSPDKEWPAALPSIAWQRWQLSGFGRDEESVAIDVGHGQNNLEQTFFSCHQNLSLPELARFYQSARNAHLNLNWPSLFHFYNLHYNDNLSQLLLAVSQTPLTFQKWTSQKDFGPRDLAILKSFPSLQNFTAVLLRVVELNPTKSQAVQILEWAGELVLMGRSVEGVVPLEIKNAEAWWKWIKSLRFAQTTSRDDEKKKHLLSMPWPSLSQVRWVRQGDEAGLEVRFLVRSAEDLKKKLKGFEHVQQLLDRNTESSWKN